MESVQVIGMHRSGTAILIRFIKVSLVFIVCAIVYTLIEMIEKTY
jgi:hypothetical protein